MRSLYITLLVLLLSSNSVFGQVSIQVDSSDPMPADDLKSVLIDDSGNMIITSTDGNYQLVKDVTPGDVSINSFRIGGLLTTTIPQEGGSAAISWSTSNAEACVASYTVLLPADTSGLTPIEWSGDVGTSSDSFTPDIVFPDTGEFELQITCQDINGKSANESVTVKVAPVSLEFTVTSVPSQPAIGDDVTLTVNWSATNATFCEASWADAGVNVGVNGSDVTVEVTTAQQDIDLLIACENDVFNAFKEVTIPVSEPLATCDVTLESKQLNNWTSSFGSVFPGPNFTRIGFAFVPSRGYASYTFETGNAQDDGYVATFQANGTSGSRLISISEVPGCFDVEPKCLAVSRDTTIEWDTTGSSDTACQLKPDTRYYWNITFTDGKTGSSTRCTSDCYAGLVVNNPDYGD